MRLSLDRSGSWTSSPATRSAGSSSSVVVLVLFVVVARNPKRGSPVGWKSRAEDQLISYRTTSGAIAISIVNGSGVGVTTAATTANRSSA